MHDATRSTPYYFGRPGSTSGTNTQDEATIALPHRWDNQGPAGWLTRPAGVIAAWSGIRHVNVGFLGLLSANPPRSQLRGVYYREAWKGSTISFGTSKFDRARLSCCLSAPFWCMAEDHAAMGMTSAKNDPSTESCLSPGNPCDVHAVYEKRWTRERSTW